MNIYQQTRELILGSRLRRLSERLISDVAQVYKTVDIDFEPPWFPLFYLLQSKGKVTVSDLAREVEITHSGASQMVTVLERKGLVRCETTPSDKRRRTVSFTDSGRTLLAQVQPVWQALQTCLKDLLQEQNNTTFLFDALDELEATMEKKGLYTRMMSDLDRRMLLDRLDLIPYQPDHQLEFRDLVLTWLHENPAHRLEDSRFLNETEKLIEQGHLVTVMACLDKEVVGTVAAQRINDNTAEIILLTVNEAYRNMDLESHLLSRLQDEVYEKGVISISHVLDSRNSAQIRIFQKEGFQLDSMDRRNEDGMTLVLNKLLNQ